MRKLGIGAAGLLAILLAREARIARTAPPLRKRWRALPIAPRRSTRLGISFRPPQVDALGLEAGPTLRDLLVYPFEVMRLGAYWNRVEPAPGRFDPSELDRQVEAAERAGKQLILCVGAIKTFGYPEFFVPAHRLARPLPEHRLVTPASHPSLLVAATEFVVRVVDRYARHPSIIAWQVEHEAVDPLGLEHSWRLSTGFVEKEIDAVRRADATRPIVLNGFLPTSWPGQLAQWWQTRDQGDSLGLALRRADLVGIDYYPRYALASFGKLTLYLDGTTNPWQRRRRERLLARARDRGQKVVVTEGQAEPWEAVTVPPSPSGRAMASCPPERVIENYNAWMSRSDRDPPLDAYLFWGAEYWMLRRQSGDPSYLRAFARILDEA